MYKHTPTSGLYLPAIAVVSLMDPHCVGYSRGTGPTVVLARDYIPKGRHYEAEPDCSGY